MRKFIPYILIITLIANIFAPFSFGINRNQIGIEKNIAKALDSEKIQNLYALKEETKSECLKENTDKEFCFRTYFEYLGETITVSAYVFGADHNLDAIRSDGYFIDIIIVGEDGKEIETLTLNSDFFEKIDGDQNLTHPTNGNEYDGYYYEKSFSTSEKILPDKKYYLDYKVSKVLKIYGVFSKIIETQTSQSDDFFILSETNTEITRSYDSTNTTQDLPNYECGVGGDKTIWGCFAQVFYLFYRITSWLFAAAGMFFDFTFGYSVNDTSYKMSFIESGWGLVRDFVNMFFIFILLYAAISLILNLNSGNAKKMIGSVIIIGLLINFSLFATRVIVDASNILARVFYNHIVIEQTAEGTRASRENISFENELNDNYKSLSAGLVNKIDPQKLVNEADQIELNSTGMNEDLNQKEKGGGIGVGAFILVIILAIAINLVGMFVFLNVGIIFLARVIGLALAMVLSPLAFFSLAAPGLKKAKIVGWDSWFKETISLAFLAPIFIFFVYLIVQFVDSGMGLFDGKSLKGVALVLSIIIPFAFIMILLKRAGSIAKDMSGEIGQAATSGLKTIGGVALGGAALGGALLARKTIGSTMKNIQNDSERQKNLKYGDFKNWSLSKKFNPFAHASQIGKTVVAAVASVPHIIPAGKNKLGENVNWGQRMQKAEKSMSEKGFSQHIVESKTQELFSNTYNKDVKYKDLREDERDKVKEAIDKDELAKFKYNKTFKELDSRGAGSVESDYNNGNRIVEDDLGKKGIATTNTTTGKRSVGYKNGTVEDFDSKKHKDMSTSFEEKMSLGGATVAVGEFISALRKGSYDVRGLSQLKSKNTGLFGKTGVGLVAGVAAGVRMGLKSQTNIQYGTPQRSFFKDLENTIGDALKSSKISMPTVQEAKNQAKGK